MENPNNYYVARYAAALVPQVYRFIATLPENERFNLVSQMRRSSSSIDDNIREGCSRQSDRAMLQFLYWANGSAGELYGQFKRSRELRVGDQRLAKSLHRKSGRLVVMLARLIEAKESRLGITSEAARRKRRRAKRG